MLTAEDIAAFREEMDASSNPPLTVPQMVEIFAETMRQEKNPEMSVDLVMEEYQEWWEEAFCVDTFGVPNGLQKDELKELADLVYVIYGYARARGWDLDEAIRRVHRNNLDRCVQPDGSVKYRADGKVIKRDNPPKIDLEDLV